MPNYEVALSVSQVLSVETALSIQSHPDKALAEKLHAKRPDVRSCSLCQSLDDLQYFQSLPAQQLMQHA